MPRLQWMNEIRPGDKVRPSPLWNKTSGAARRLPETVEVLDVIHGVCETGLMFRVRSVGGIEADLAASWFEGPA